MSLDLLHRTSLLISSKPRKQLKSKWEAQSAQLRAAINASKNGGNNNSNAPSIDEGYVQCPY